MSENTEKTKNSSTNAITIGVKSRETADRFLSMKNGSYAGTYEEAVKLLLDAYENPPKDADSAATIANLQQRVKDLESDITAYQTANGRDSSIQERDNTIEDLRGKLNDTVLLANSNAERAQSIQVATEGAIILKPNPVVAHFLNEMAAETNSTPERILEELFLADLQNPTVNNLPYTVTSREIRRVMEELKSKED